MGLVLDRQTVPINLIVYGFLALAVMGAIGEGVHQVKKWGGEDVRAELQPKIDFCHASIEAQNAAVQQLRVEGDRRIAAATIGVAKAQEGTKAARSEAERLRVLAGTQAEPSACPAGAAVAEVRKGL